SSPNTPPPGTGLPAPTLNLPPVLPVNAILNASYPSQYQIVSYQWSLLQTNVTTDSNGNGAIGRTTSANLSTTGGFVDLAPQNLAPGSYQITVTVMDSNGNVSLPATADVTLVAASTTGARVYPDPWRANQQPDIPITFDQMTTQGTLKIFTVSGHLVRSMPISNGLARWDLTNDSGDKVGSGIYLYLVTSADDSQTRGKFAIIR
ncbi:MAG TPA: T9SS type A sorting domain-containing protein, partial [Elusimicrobiota bacterium]|nr:T9SS type A sorting domain-containing protein [Elusimicrobiota bacterium]